MGGRNRPKQTPENGFTTNARLNGMVCTRTTYLFPFQ